MPYPQYPNHPMPDSMYHQRPADVGVNDRGQQPMPMQPDHTYQSRPTNIGFVDRGQQPLRPQNNFITQKPQTSTLDHRGEGTNNNHFATDSFFAGSEEREWTQEQESKWQATTKAPFFENTVPGNEHLYLK